MNKKLIIFLVICFISYVFSISYFFIQNVNYSSKLEEQIEINKQLIEENEKIRELSSSIQKEKELIEEQVTNLTKQNEDLLKLIEELKSEIETLEKTAWKNFKATAYTTYENGDEYASRIYGNLTASGTTVKQGRTIAVDRNLIPLGTKVEIQFPDEYSYMNGTFIAEDTGNAIKGNKIDVYFDSINVCNQFGIRDVKLRIIG